MNLDELRQLKLIKKEAERIATYLANIQAGSGTTDANGDASVTFPSPYSDVPKVLLQGVDSSYRGIVLDVISKSKTGFVVKARKVTGITGGGAIGTVDPAVGGTAYTHSYENHTHTFTGSSGTTGSGGVDHVHWYSGTTWGPSTTATPVNNVYYSTTSVASSGHSHVFLKGRVTMTHTPAGYFNYSGADQTAEISYSGVTTDPLNTGTPSATTTVVTSVSVDRVTVASDTHTHGFSGTTGGASAYFHAHGFTPSGTISASLTLLVSYHYHTSDSPVLSCTFDWLSILP